MHLGLMPLMTLNARMPQLMPPCAAGGRGPDVEGFLWPAQNDRPGWLRRVLGSPRVCDPEWGARLTCACADVLCAHCLPHQVVLVQPGAIFCHHHRLGCAVGPDIDNFGIRICICMGEKKGGVNMESFAAWHNQRCL